MRKSILLGFVVASSVLPLPASAAAQEEVFKDTNTYASCQDRFAVIFPSNPSMRDVPYVMRSGRSAAARQHYLERGADRFSVTVVVLANAPAVDEEIINHLPTSCARRATFAPTIRSAILPACAGASF